MKLKIFAVYDSKAEAYARPFFDQATGAAVRSFAEIANDKNHPIGKHPGDYTLFEIGEYNDQNGEIKNNDANVALGAAIEFLHQRPSTAEMLDAITPSN